MSSASEATNASAHIERVNGGFVVSALWMLHVGKAHRRGHMLTSFSLKLLPGRRFSISSIPGGSSPLVTLSIFVRIVRLMHRLSRMALSAGDRKASLDLLPSIRFKPFGSYVVDYLQKIAAKPVGSFRRTAVIASEEGKSYAGGSGRSKRPNCPTSKSQNG